MLWPLTLERVRRDDSFAGPLLATFVLGELARQLTWATTTAHIYHYRNRDGQEVDAFLESDDGRVVAIEVKSSTTARAEDFHHLEHLRRALGPRFQHGLVVYTGSRVLPFGDRLTALPIGTLWADRPLTQGPRFESPT